MRLFRRQRTESRPDRVPSPLGSGSAAGSRPSLDFRSLSSLSAHSTKQSTGGPSEDDGDDTVEIIHTPQKMSPSSTPTSTLRLGPQLRKAGTLSDISKLLMNQSDSDIATTSRKGNDIERFEPCRTGLSLERSQPNLREEAPSSNRETTTTTHFLARHRTANRTRKSGRPATADGAIGQQRQPFKRPASFATSSPSSSKQQVTVLSSKFVQPRSPAEKCRSESEERDTASVVTHILPRPFGFAEDAFEERVDLVKGLVACYAEAETPITTSSPSKNRRLHSPGSGARHIVERLERRTERMLVELLAVDRVDRQSIIELRLPLVFALARQQCGLHPSQSIFKPFESEAEAGALSLGSPIVYPGFGAIRSLSEVIEPHGKQESGLVFFGNEPEPIMPSLSPPPRAPRPRPRRPTTAPTTPTRSALGAHGSPDLASSKRMTMVATPPRRSSRRIAPVMPLMVPTTAEYLDVTSREELPWTPTWSTHAASAEEIGFPEGGVEREDGSSLPRLSPSSRQAALSLKSSVRPKSRDASSSTKSSFTHGSSQGHDSSARVSFSTSATSSPNISFTGTKSLFT